MKDRELVKAQAEADKAVALAEQKCQYAASKLEDLEAKYQSLKNEHLKTKEKLEQSDKFINVLHQRHTIETEGRTRGRKKCKGKIEVHSGERSGRVEAESRRMQNQEHVS